MLGLIFFHKPSLPRPRAVIRGYRRAARRSNRIAQDLKKLNEIMLLVPDLVANNSLAPEDLRDMLEAMNAFGNSSDNLAAAMVTNGQLMQKLVTAMEFYEKYGR